MKNKKHSKVEELKDDCGCESKECHCKDNCKCTKEDNCGCGKCEGHNEKCHCNENCKCEDNCNYNEHDCCCGDDCDCECDCDDECDCGCCHEISEEAGQYLELAQRVQAEFDNYRKRNAEAVKEAEQRGIVKAVEKLLPIVDSITSAKRQLQNEEMKKSIDTLYNQIIQLFGGLNVKKIEAKGLEFNPHKHYAVLTEEVEGVKPDIVLEELQEGFEMGDKVVRHTVVKVSK